MNEKGITYVCLDGEDCEKLHIPFGKVSTMIDDMYIKTRSLKNMSIFSKIISDDIRYYHPSKLINRD